MVADDVTFFDGMWHIAHNGDSIARCRFSTLTNINVAALDQEFVSIPKCPFTVPV